jgi:hypothetical protein
MAFDKIVESKLAFKTKMTAKGLTLTQDNAR